MLGEQLEPNGGLMQLDHTHMNNDQPRSVTAVGRSQFELSTTGGRTDADGDHQSTVQPATTFLLNFLANDVDPPLQRWLGDQLARIASNSGMIRGRVTIVLVDDAYMAKLHRQYKGTADTTDVLTFDMRDQPTDPLEADVVICLDEAARHPNDTRHEVLLYAIHGLLHLRGYDDRDPLDAAVMHRKEDEWLTKIGIGPVYQREQLDV